jgi:hypothetical protein
MNDDRGLLKAGHEKRAVANPGPQPPEGDARNALAAFVLAHYHEVREHALLLARGNEAKVPELEQLAYLELWSLDPTRYSAADAPFLLEALRRAMRLGDPGEYPLAYHKRRRKPSGRTKREAGLRSPHASQPEPEGRTS